MARSHDELMLLWRHSVPMSRAAECFAPQDLREKFASLKRQESDVSIVDQFRAMTATGGPDSLENAELRAKAELAKLAATEHGKLISGMQYSLLFHLRGGSMLGFGFEPSSGFPVYPRRSVRDTPVELLPEHWNEWLSWNNNMVRFGGLRIIEVRLLLRETLNNLVVSSAEQTSTEAGTPGRGRCSAP